MLQQASEVLGDGRVSLAFRLCLGNETDAFMTGTMLFNLLDMPSGVVPVCHVSSEDATQA